MTLALVDQTTADGVAGPFPIRPSPALSGQQTVDSSVGHAANVDVNALVVRLYEPREYRGLWQAFQVTDGTVVHQAMHHTYSHFRDDPTASIGAVDWIALALSVFPGSRSLYPQEREGYEALCRRLSRPVD